MADLGHLRIDQLGSLVRPTSLRELFNWHADGRATDEELRDAQDAAIEDVVRVQEKLGLPVIGDGEFRRRTFVESYADVKGSEFSTARIRRGGFHPRSGWAEVRTGAPVCMTELQVGERMELVSNRPLQEYEFAQALTEKPVKVTLLSANQVWQLYSPDVFREIYASDEALLSDVIAVQRQIIGELVDAGCTYIQVDGPGYAAYRDPSWVADLRGRGLDPTSVLCRSAAADRAAIEGFAGVTFGIHLCRGNAQQCWPREGTYDGTAEALFNTLPHDRFLLECDTEGAGSFDALRFVPTDKVIVLGLISTKTPKLESEDDLLRQIDEASQHIAIDQLAISPQCGFSSGIAGSQCTADEQWRKLELMLAIADKVWWS